MNDDRANPFDHGQLPDWVCGWGEDASGVWLAFEVSGVQQVMRWIPPGKFTMGSPPNEPGRFDNEGPQHEVTFTRGFWLAETPCTQALWCAVMGSASNPSRFVDALRPVERVSFDDVDQFLARTERLVPGLEPRLPSEAEWEYACQAASGSPPSDPADDLPPYPGGPVKDPMPYPGAERPFRVVRGGAWSGSARFVRAAYRDERHRADRRHGLS